MLHGKSSAKVYQTGFIVNLAHRTFTPTSTISNFSRLWSQTCGFKIGRGQVCGSTNCCSPQFWVCRRPALVLGSCFGRLGPASAQRDSFIIADPKYHEPEAEAESLVILFWHDSKHVNSTNLKQNSSNETVHSCEVLGKHYAAWREVSKLAHFQSCMHLGPWLLILGATKWKHDSTDVSARSTAYDSSKGRKEATYSLLSWWEVCYLWSPQMSLWSLL